MSNQIEDPRTTKDVQEMMDMARESLSNKETMNKVDHLIEEATAAETSIDFPSIPFRPESKETTKEVIKLTEDIVVEYPEPGEIVYCLECSQKVVITRVKGERIYHFDNKHLSERSCPVSHRQIIRTSKLEGFNKVLWKKITALEERLNMQSERVNYPTEPKIELE